MFQSSSIHWLTIFESVRQMVKKAWNSTAQSDFLWKEKTIFFSKYVVCEWEKKVVELTNVEFHRIF